MGLVLSKIVRFICGEAEKDKFIHSIPTSSSSSNPNSDSSTTDMSINPLTVDPHGDTYIIGSLHQNPTPFPQIKCSSHPSTLDHEPLLDQSISASTSFESLRNLSSIEEEEEEKQVSPFRSKVNSIETREEEKVNKGVVLNEMWMNDYCNLHNILLVGEGDFSFSASLALVFGSAPNIVATSLISPGYLGKNYPRAMSNIQELTSRGCKVVHGMDATEMVNNVLLVGMKFDRIVFNFPHAGFFPNTSCETQPKRHRKLVKLFMENAKKMITAKGEIHIRHKSKGFFINWNLELLGSIQGLRLIEDVHLNFTVYPGYCTKYGFGSDTNFNCNPSKRTMDFSLSTKEGGERRIKHYTSSHNILLVGEGDFSFAVCLAKAFDSALNIVATSLNSQETLMAKHPSARANLNQLEKLGCTILHEVDAFTMSQHPHLYMKVFDRIVFNFPHAGFYQSEHTSIQISMHKDVVKGFLRSAHKMLTQNGEVHVTHKTAHPFNKWEIEELAEEVGLRLVEKARFSKCDYPGYYNKRGSGSKSNKRFPVGECSTFKFAKPTFSPFS